MQVVVGPPSQMGDNRIEEFDSDRYHLINWTILNKYIITFCLFFNLVAHTRNKLQRASVRDKFIYRVFHKKLYTLGKTNL